MTLIQYNYVSASLFILTCCIRGQRSVYGVFKLFGDLITFVLVLEPDGGPKLQRAAADQEEKERGIQWGDWWEREACENPQMYRGEEALIKPCICSAAPVSFACAPCVDSWVWFIFTHRFTVAFKRMVESETLNSNSMHDWLAYQVFFF